MAGTFRHSAAFGKRVEFWIIGEMLKEGLDVYVPVVDDDAIDAVVRRPDGTFAAVQIKARSSDCTLKVAGLFANIAHAKLREKYWFIFYSERMDMKWIMSSEEFMKESYQNKTGKHTGTRSIGFNGQRTNRTDKSVELYCLPRFELYIAKDFQRLVTG